MNNTNFNLDNENNWTNAHNFAFYDKLGVLGLIDRAMKCGLEDQPDLEALRPIFSGLSSPNILDIGSGYGRVSDWLMRNVKNVSITLVEHSKPLFLYLERKFNSSNCTVLNEDILNMSLNENFDLALLLWSGIADFSESEKPILLERVSKRIKEDGKLVIDLPPEVTRDAIRKEEGQLVLNVSKSTHHGHLPSETELKELMINCSFTQSQKIDYISSNGLSRRLFVFSRH